MSMYLRGSVYWVEFRDPDGNRVRESTGTSDREKAKSYHDLRQHQLTEGREKPGTWDDAVERWLRERTDKRSLDRDESMIRWLHPHFRRRIFATITDDEVRHVVELKKQETTASNANHYLKFIRALFNRSIEWKWLASSPVKMKPYRTSDKRIRFLSEAELARLLTELPHHLRMMAEFSVLTGLRMSNVTGLKWDRVDLSRRIAWVDSTEYKSGRNHGIPLGQRAIEILLGEQGCHPMYVFTYRGYPVQNANNTAWRSALSRAGITDFRWHDLRHTFASYHALNGTPLLTLKALGGWQSLSMVNRYAHLATEGTRQYVLEHVPGVPPTAVGACGNSVGESTHTPPTMSLPTSSGNRS